jgi:hypothetical protein
MKNTGTLFSALLLLLTLTFSSPVVAAEIQLPPVATSLSGKFALEALLEALKVENVPLVLEKFKPMQEGMEWTSHPVETRNEVSTVHLSFHQLSKASEEEERGSGDSYWGYFKGKVSSTVSAVTQVATKLFAHGEFIGEVTRSDLSSARNVDGFRLDIVLSRSSMVITSLVTHFSIEITLDNVGTSEKPLVNVTLACAMKPGIMFPGMQDPQVGPFIVTQLTAWAEAVKDAAQEQQVLLLNSSL